MNFLKSEILILAAALCHLSICFAEPVPAAEIPIFEPGKEYHVKTNNKAIGTQSFNVFVPLDYTDDRDWPVVFRYKGRDERYNPIICRAGRLNICDRGAIVVGMGYVEYGNNKLTASEFKDYIKRELDSIYETKKLISKHLRIDDDRLFISGTSAGGWLVSDLLEYKAQVWAGAMIFVAGLHPNASVLTNEKSLKAFRGLPVFIGSSPEGSHGANHKWALKAKDVYKQRGAIVTFETYDGEGLVHSPLLRDWNRAFILDGKNDSARDKIAKARQFTQTKLENIESMEIIKTQIAKQLNKQADQLTNDDLLEIKQLSLVGENISDIANLANLINLESLDISFTYVNDLSPLLACKNLQKLNLSGTYVEDIKPLKDLPQLDTLSMWNLWLDRSQINTLKKNLPDLKIPDYQWDIYETDSIGRIEPKLTVELN